MKKSRFALFLAFMLSLILIFASACNEKSLSAPEELDLDDSYKLKWTSVENARGYTISVTDTNGGSQELTARINYISLSNLDEGDYDIKVKANGNGNDYLDSEWSETIYFHRDYESGCVYELINNDTEYRVSRAGSASGTVEIGDTYRNKPITAIKDAAFRNSNLVENIIIGNNVTTIGSSAFYSCAKLKSITIPETVTYIGKSAFQACYQLTDVVLPKSITEISDNMFNYCRNLVNVTYYDVTSIGDYAFADCTKLETATIPDSVLTIGDYAFAGMLALTEVTIGKGVQSIGEYAFYNDSALETVNFSDDGNLTSISDYSFSNCTALQKIDLPKGLDTIGNYAFLHTTSLDQVTIPDSMNEIGYYAFLYSKLFNDALENEETFVFADKWLVSLVYYGSSSLVEVSEESFKSGTVGIANGVFANCENLLRVTLAPSVKIIGQYAFYNCSALWYLRTYDNSLETVGKFAFRDCGALTRVLFGTGLKSIERGAFYNCTFLANNTSNSEYLVPSTVTHIGSQAFYGTELWDSADDYGVIYAGNWVVGYSGLDSYLQFGWLSSSVTSNQSSIVLSDDVIGISDYAFYNDEDLRQVDGAVRASYIGKGAFYGCSNLATINLNRNLRKIEDYTFYDCESLFTVSVPSRVSSIGRSAFYNCLSLSSIDLSAAEVKTIGDFAFYNCNNLESALLGDELESIGRYSFYHCDKLVEVSFPKTLKTIDDAAFRSCSELTTVDFGQGVETIGKNAFSYCTSLTSITLPDTVVSIDDRAFYQCSSVESISLGNSVETIGDYAFAFLGSVSDVVIPMSVKSIGSYAFRNTDINTLILSKNVKVIGQHAFYGCYDMSIYTDAESIGGEWDKLWNSSYRPLFYGCTLSENGDYVVSIKYSESSAQNYHDDMKVSVPVRKGYTFLGWTTQERGTTVQYTFDNMNTVTDGTLLYAIWLQE